MNGSSKGAYLMRFYKVVQVLLFSWLLFGCAKQVGMYSNNLDARYEIVGIDVSKYQGTIDFNKVKQAGAKFVFVRATEGNTYQDANFLVNLAKAREAGLATGAYHFYETNDDPHTQLDNFKSIVLLRSGDLPPVIDIEKLHNQNKTHLVDNIQVFLEGLEAHYGVKPILYSGHKFSNKYLTHFGEYPLWIAEYGVDEPRLPKGWTDWRFWQWSQSSTMSGIKGQVDANRFNGNDAEFRDLLLK